MHSSLIQIGDNEPVLVLAKSLSFLNKLSRSQKGHRVLVMNMMSECLDKNVDLKLPSDLANGLVIMSVLEIVAEKVCILHVSVHMWRDNHFLTDNRYISL